MKLIKKISMLLLATALIIFCSASLSAYAAMIDDNPECISSFSLDEIPNGGAIMTLGECSELPVTAKSVAAFDPAPYIEKIERGEILPLSEGNLPGNSFG